MERPGWVSSACKCCLSLSSSPSTTRECYLRDHPIKFDPSDLLHLFVLGRSDRNYESMASKFFEHFIAISDAISHGDEGMEGPSLWNEDDGFYYDSISWSSGHSQQIPVRSMVGLMPLYATLVLEPSVIKRFPGFKKRMDWVIENRAGEPCLIYVFLHPLTLFLPLELASRNIANMKAKGRGDRKLLAFASKERLVKILEKMLDEKEFLSEHGIRS